MPKELTEALSRVEEERGIPVEVTADPSMPTLASIRSARVPATHHVLTHDPTRPSVDHHVAYDDPTPEHDPGSPPSDFTGLRLVGLLYGGFEQVNPRHGMAFDPSRERGAAQRPFVAKKG